MRYAEEKRAAATAIAELRKQVAAKKANSDRSGVEKQAMEITIDCLRSQVVTMQVEQRGGAAVVLALQKQQENAWAGHSGHSAWGPPHVPNLEMGGDKSNRQAGYHSYWPETGGPGGYLRCAGRVLVLSAVDSGYSGPAGQV